MGDFILKMNANDAIFSTTNATINPNDATLNSYCFITVYFSDPSHTSTSPYHSVIYFNDAINLLAGLC